MGLSVGRKSSKVSKGTMALYDHHTPKDEKPSINGYRDMVQKRITTNLRYLTSVT
jgi:hypothetical protein